MNITKYKHACFVVEKDGETLVVDPGNFTDDFVVPDNVTAVVVTHEHGDHLDEGLLADIAEQNSDAVVVGPPSVTDNIKDLPTRTVQPGDTLTLGAFTLSFFGGTHALIHDSIPRIENVGVMINDLIYYPGDSLDAPDRPVDVLALPAVAPWMKIGEAMDFLIAVHPRFAFPTHDALYTPASQAMVDRMLARVAEGQGGEYQRIDATPYSI